MLSTRELIATIKSDYAQNVSVTKLTKYLDRVQRMIFLDETWFATFVNPNDVDFAYPFLETVAGQLEYEMVDGALTDSEGLPLPFELQGRPAEASEVKHVLYDITYGSGIQNREIEYMLYRRRGNEDSIVDLGNHSFRTVSCRLIPRTQDKPATIIFSNDPMGMKFNVQVALAAPRLLDPSGNIVIDIDRWEKALIDGVVGEAEEAINGTSKKAIKYQDYWIPKIRATLNRPSADSDQYEVVKREFA